MEGVPLGVFKLDYARGEDDREEYDTNVSDGYGLQDKGCDRDAIRGPYLQYLYSRLLVPRCLLTITVQFNFPLVSCSKYIMK